MKCLNCHHNSTLAAAVFCRQCGIRFSNGDSALVPTAAESKFCFTCGKPNGESVPSKPVGPVTSPPTAVLPLLTPKPAPSLLTPVGVTGGANRKRHFGLVGKPFVPPCAVGPKAATPSATVKDEKAPLLPATPGAPAVTAAAANGNKENQNPNTALLRPLSDQQKAVAESIRAKRLKAAPKPKCVSPELSFPTISLFGPAPVCSIIRGWFEEREDEITAGYAKPLVEAQQFVAQLKRLVPTDEFGADDPPNGKRTPKTDENVLTELKTLISRVEAAVAEGKQSQSTVPPLDDGQIVKLAGWLEQHKAGIQAGDPAEVSQARQFLQQLKGLFQSQIAYDQQRANAESGSSSSSSSAAGAAGGVSSARSGLTKDLEKLIVSAKEVLAEGDSMLLSGSALSLTGINDAAETAPAFADEDL